MQNTYMSCICFNPDIPSYVKLWCGAVDRCSKSVFKHVIIIKL